MLKRPLCLAAILYLIIQAILTGGFRIAKDLKPSLSESRLKPKELITVTGTVYRREVRDGYQALYLKTNQIDYQRNHQDQIIYESQILIYIKENPNIQSTKDLTDRAAAAVGNRIRAVGSVSYFEEARNPGNFDQKFYYQKQGIHLLVWAEEAQIVNAKTWWLHELLTTLRCRWQEQLLASLGPYYGGNMSAILLGEKSIMDQEIKMLYQKSGIGHILAISGLHMSFIGIGLFAMMRKAGIPFWAAGLTGMGLLLMYTVMIGPGPSSLRALIMFAVRMGAEITGRNYDAATSLAIAAAGIIAWQPLYLIDAGFLLSFGAIAGIILILPVLEAIYKDPDISKHTMLFTMKKSLLASLAINLMLLPIMLYFYFEIPLYSVLLNLLVIPLMSVVLGAGLLGSLLLSIWRFFGIGVLSVCKAVLWIYEKVSGFSMILPGSRLVIGQPQKWQMAGYYLILFLILVIVKSKFVCERCASRRISNSGLARRSVKLPVIKIIITVSFFLMLFTLYPLHNIKGGLTVTMVDVGQGDGIFIRGPSGKCYLVDGGSSDVSSVGKYRLEPFLASQGVSQLDYVFLSHGDSDHMSGLLEILENQDLGIRVQTLVLPTEAVHDEKIKELAAAAKKNDTRVAVIEAGQSLTEKKSLEDTPLTFTCLRPSQDYTGEIGNGSSMILLLNYGEFDMLFTGDVGQDGEMDMTEKMPDTLALVDVLKVAHHGSKSSSAKSFLQQVSPSVALISAGINNRYGHPHPDVIERLEDQKCRIYATDNMGAITLWTDGDKIKLHGFCK